MDNIGLGSERGWRGSREHHTRPRNKGGRQEGVNSPLRLSGEMGQEDKTQHCQGSHNICRLTVSAPFPGAASPASGQSMQWEACKCCILGLNAEVFWLTCTEGQLRDDGPMTRAPMERVLGVESGAAVGKPDAGRKGYRQRQTRKQEAFHQARWRKITGKYMAVLTTVKPFLDWTVSL